MGRIKGATQEIRAVVNVMKEVKRHGDDNDAAILAVLSSFAMQRVQHLEANLNELQLIVDAEIEALQALADGDTEELPSDPQR